MINFYYQAKIPDSQGDNHICFINIIVKRESSNVQLGIIVSEAVVSRTIIITL